MDPETSAMQNVPCIETLSRCRSIARSASSSLWV